MDMKPFREFFDVEKFVEKQYGQENCQFCIDPVAEYFGPGMGSLLSQSIAKRVGIEYAPNPGFWVGLKEEDSKEQLREKLGKLYTALELYEKLENSQEIQNITKNTQQKLDDLVKTAISE